MARRPFDPGAEGLSKTEYRQADVLDVDAVREVISGADVVVHLAFMIMGGVEETTEINLQGSRNVFDGGDRGRGAAARLCLVGGRLRVRSPTIPALLTEDLEPRGPERHYYSAQKAELEWRCARCSGFGHRRVRIPALHRRRSRCAHARAEHPVRADLREDAIGDPARARVHARTQARHPGPGRPVPARPSRRCGSRRCGRRSSAGASPGLQPRRHRDVDDGRPRRRAGLVQHPDARPRAGRGRRARRAAAVRAGWRRNGSRVSGGRS